MSRSLPQAQMGDCVHASAPAFPCMPPPCPPLLPAVAACDVEASADDCGPAAGVSVCETANVKNPTPITTRNVRPLISTSWRQPTEPRFGRSCSRIGRPTSLRAPRPLPGRCGRPPRSRKPGRAPAKCRFRMTVRQAYPRDSRHEATGVDAIESSDRPFNGVRRG
jgi:hypothetical protein